MSAQQEVKGFVVTPAKLAFVLSIIGVLTFGYRMVDYVKSIEFQVSKNTEYVIEDKGITKEFALEQKNQGRKLDEVIFTLRAVQEQLQKLSK